MEFFYFEIMLEKCSLELFYQYYESIDGDRNFEKFGYLFKYLEVKILYFFFLMMGGFRIKRMLIF